MRGGVLSDSYIDEICREFKPVPMGKAQEILKIEHPVNPYSGIKPIYNQSVAVPASVSTMVSNIHRANMKAGDVTSDYEELLTGVVGDIKTVKNEIDRYIDEEEARLPRPRDRERTRPARGGARQGSGRMNVGESALKEQIEGGLAFKEKIQKKDIQEAIRYSGGDFNEAISRVVSNKKQEAVGKVLEGIMKNVEAQIEARDN
tara:strand:+ start:98 stop:706 length:609 start_codon:yes stop_codon:yes gene_type:complete